MNPFEILKQFKNIEPDPAFKEISKRAILAHTPKEAWGTRKVIAAFFETGVAVALSVFFILVMTGILPTSSSYISPAQFSVINPTSLHAEAQAIDIQIQLANVSYNEATTSAESTPLVAAVAASHPATSFRIQSPSVAAAIAQPATSSPAANTSTVSIDQALQELAQ